MDLINELLLLEAAKEPKVYTIFSSRDSAPGRELKTAGTLPELIKKFSYTLEKGASWQNEKGNKKINRNPKNIQSLVDNLYNAENNAAANGYGGRHYRFEEGDHTGKKAVTESAKSVSKTKVNEGTMIENRTNARKVTTKLLDMCESGSMSWETIARECLNFLSEDDVADLAEKEGWIEDESDLEEGAVIDFAAQPKFFAYEEAEMDDEVYVHVESEDTRDKDPKYAGISVVFNKKDKPDLVVADKTAEREKQKYPRSITRSAVNWMRTHHKDEGYRLE